MPVCEPGLIRAQTPPEPRGTDVGGAIVFATPVGNGQTEREVPSPPDRHAHAKA